MQNIFNKDQLFAQKNARLLIGGGIVGILLLIGVGLLLPKQKEKPKEYKRGEVSLKVPEKSGVSIPLRMAPDAPAIEASVEQQKSFFAVVLESRKNALSIQRITPPQQGAISYQRGEQQTITLRNDTEYNAQRELPADKNGTVAFYSQAGKLSDIKTGWFVFVELGSDSSADRVTYSQSSPY